MIVHSSCRAVCLLATWAAIVPMMTQAQDQDKRDTQRQTAAEMMQKAHATRAEWRQFPGFSADLVVFAGTQRTKGQLNVSKEGEVELQLSADDSLSWVNDDLQSLVDHRLPSGDREYDVSFDDVDVTGMGRQIRFNDDSMHSVYRIRHNVITEVHRTMGPKKLLISVMDVKRNREKKHLPRTYSVSWIDVKSGRLLSTETVNNQWVRIGDLDLPSRVLKVVHDEDGSRDVLDLRLSNHKLHTPAG